MPAPPPPETIYIDAAQVACDGSGEVSPALGDPFECVRTLLATGTAGAHRDDFAEVRDRLDPERVPVVEEGFRLTAADVGAALIQRAQHTDVRKPLESTAAQDERDASSHGCLRRPDGRGWAQHVSTTPKVKCRAR